ncbi:MAG: hypothetical protein GYA21_08565, partial [Myxococcales bacterium]|nr:hypothetical protein [Myxococcales bacterium]
CNGLDDDCDNIVPANEADTDSDNWWVCANDCNDIDPQVYPGATERCNSLDDDCDNVIPTNEADADNDGYRICANDCNDNDPAMNPSATERCNGLDDNCDNVVPANEADADSDGYRICAGDCLDTNPAVNPGRPEAPCNGLDDNCDSILPVDERDQDSDGFRPCNGDCNDFDPAVNPNAVEVCNRIDDNCDTLIDRTVAGGLCGIGQLCDIPVNPGDEQCASPLYCQHNGVDNTNRCTHWCNNSYDMPGDTDGVHECPTGYGCTAYSNTDSAGFCWAASGTILTGQACSVDSDCRSGWCRDIGGGVLRCWDVCAKDADCMQDSTTNNYRCVLYDITSPNGSMVHGLCRPETGTGSTGASCTSHSQCRDGFCNPYSYRCVNLCSTELDCTSPYICDWWPGEDYSGRADDSTFKACWNYWTTRGTWLFGTACTPNPSGSIYQQNCRSGLCFNFDGTGTKCGNFCNLNTDCPSGYHCDFFFSVGTNGLLRACVPN